MLPIQNQFCETCRNRVGKTTEYERDHLFFYTTFCQRFSTTGCKTAADQVYYPYQKKPPKTADFLQNSGDRLSWGYMLHVQCTATQWVKICSVFCESIKSSRYSSVQDWQGGLKVNIAVDKAISISIMWILIQLISLLANLPKWDKMALANNARWNR